MNFFKKLLHAGTSKNHSTEEVKRIKVVNLIAYISIIHSVFFLFFDSFTGTLNLEQFISLTGEFFIFSTVFYAQYRGYLKFAKFLLIFLIFASLFYHCNFAFKGYYGEYQYIVLPLFSLFFFKKKIIHYLTLILSITVFYLPNYYLKLYPDQYFGYSNVALMFVGVFFIVKYFTTLTNANENLLETEKNKVLIDKETLEKQQAELKALEEFKSNFFINLSHEIRTPLTLIKGYASRIKLNEQDKINYNSLETIKSQTEYIYDIVDSILDLSKLESNKLEINKKELVLGSFLKKLHLDFEELFNSKNISFTTDKNIPEIAIIADAGFLRKSLNNLLHNAYKFTPKEGTVTLSVVYQKELEISIIDNGIGIPKEDIENIFDRFYQSKNHITQSQGSGIGLPFTKSIVDAHGFKINLKSIPNEQTTFTITIPQDYIKQIEHQIIGQDLFETNPKITKRIIPQVVDKNLKSILIVEDHSEMRDYLKLILKDYHIIEATDGTEGLEALKKHSFDIILTDYMMPVMDGYSFVNEVKKQDIKTPIIVITARGDNKAKLDILRLGIDAYMTKPFIEEELLLTVEKSITFYDEINFFKQTIPEEEKLVLSNDELLFNDKLKSIIKENYKDKNFGVEALSDLMQLSRSSLFRKTKLFLGQTPNQIINEVRLQRAKELLEEQPEIKKKDLADAIGVYNATYFYKKLSNKFG